MIQAASPIQIPSASVLAELLILVQTGSVTSGPVLAFDRERQVFLTVVVDQGVVIKWQIESCRDDVEAQAMRDQCQTMILEAQARLSAPGAAVAQLPPGVGLPAPAKPTRH